jgi:hypothetical protein
MKLVRQRAIAQLRISTTDAVSMRADGVVLMNYDEALSGA